MNLMVLTVLELLLRVAIELLPVIGPKLGSS